MMVQSDRKHAIIVGAGPAGLATAGFLAQDGWICDVYEASSRDRAASTSPEYLDRAYGLSCQVRALRVLKGLDALQDVLNAGGYWREASFRHDARRGALPVFESSDTSRTLSCLRTELVNGILSALERQWGDQIRIHWETPVERIRINDEGRVYVEGAMEGSIVVCADGATSPIGRKSMATLNAAFSMQAEPSGLETRTLMFNDQAEVSINNERQKWIPRSNSLHFIIGQKDRLLLLGRHTGPRPAPAMGVSSGIQTILVYPHSHRLASPDLDAGALKTVLDETFTPAQIPLENLSTSDLQRCAQGRAAALPGVVQCSDYNYRNLVLIGDAAHCSPTNNAQGVNVALEDASILAGLLTGNGIESLSLAGDDFTEDERLAQFTAIRKPEMDALQRMLSHPFYASARPTWRTFTVSTLHETTGWERLQPMKDQVYEARLPLTECERNMLIQYHLPLILAVVSISGMVALTIVLSRLISKVLTDGLELLLPIFKSNLPL